MCLGGWRRWGGVGSRATLCGMTTEQLFVGFVSALGVSVAVLVAAMVCAHKKMVRAHVGLVGGFLVTFLVTLGFAEVLGRRYTFAEPIYTIHMGLAIFTTLALGVPLVTGVRHWYGKGGRGVHTRSVGVWLVCLVLALVTGVWMLYTATPIADGPV